LNSPRAGKATPFAARLLVLFSLASVVFGTVAYLLVSNLKAWSFEQCGNNSTVLCAVSGLIVGYWWLAAVPGIAATDVRRDQGLR
jgi:hypothetical protein